MGGQSEDGIFKVIRWEEPTEYIREYPACINQSMMTSPTNWYSGHQSLDEDFNYLPYFTNESGYRYALETREGRVILNEKEGIEYYDVAGLPYDRPGSRLPPAGHNRQSELTRADNESMERHVSPSISDNGKYSDV